MHAYHEALPGFNEEHILHEGCEECESRANLNGLLQLDRHNARHAVERAVQMNRYGGLDTNEVEVKLLNAAWVMLVFLQRHTEIDGIEDGLPWRDFSAMERSLGL